MTSTDRSSVASLVARFGEWLHRYFLLLLLACYALAALWPGPGQALRNASIVLPTGGAQHAPMLLLALLLFFAAFSVSWFQIRDVLDRPSVAVASLMAAWLGPALLVGAASAILPRLTDDAATSGLLVGLALVAAMPVANSSAGWSQNAGGNVALSLGLIVLSIVLSPLVTPPMLQLMGLVLSSDDTAKIGRVVAEFSGWKFMAWVILPSLAGAGTAWFVGADRVAAARPWIRLITLVDLMLLNYANASLALNTILREEPLAAVAVASLLAVAISLVGAGVGACTGRLFRVGAASQTALVFGLSMKHTGLALVLAGEVLADQPRVILLIVLATLAQHVIAAAIDWRLQRSAGLRESTLSDSTSVGP